MELLLKLEIETHDRLLQFEMFEAVKSLSSENSQVTLADGSTVAYRGTLERKAIDFPAIIHAAGHIATDVGISLFSSWLYDKIKGRATKLKINHQDVEITPERIRIVIETIEKEG